MGKHSKVSSSAKWGLGESVVFASDGMLNSSC